MARTTSRRSQSRPRDHKDDLAAQVVEAALALAEERGWTAVRLHDIADRLGVEPGQVLALYRDLDAVSDAWFRRGWEAMVAPKGADFAALPAKQRIEICLLAWFDAFAPHHRVTVQMLRGKMHFPHLHHWVPMVFNLSRTIQLLREAALLPAVYGTRRAEMEEVGLTSLFVSVLFVWSRDDTPGQERTRKVLSRRLDLADRMMARIWGPGRPRTKGRTSG